MYTSNFAPQQKKLFTTEELAHVLGCGLSTLTGLKKKLDLYEHSWLETTSYGRHTVWDYTAYLVLETYMETMKEKREKIKKIKAEKKALKIKKDMTMPEKELSIEEMKKLHPLVKNERFFVLSYFPETKPNCFDEIED